MLHCTETTASSAAGPPTQVGPVLHTHTGAFRRTACSNTWRQWALLCKSCGAYGCVSTLLPVFRGATSCCTGVTAIFRAQSQGLDVLCSRHLCHVGGIAACD